MRSRRRLNASAIIAAATFVILTMTGSAANATDTVMFSATQNVSAALVQRILAEPATGRIDMSAWLLNDSDVYNALLVAYRDHHVKVRLMGDRGSNFETDPPTKYAFEYLAANGVPIRLRYNPTWYPEIDHWKVTIFKSQGVVEFGSPNYVGSELGNTSCCSSATNYNDEVAMFTDDPQIFNAFLTRFDRMWNDTTTELYADGMTVASQQGGPPYYKDWFDACKLESACNDYWTSYNINPNSPPPPVDRTRLEGDNPMPADMVWGQGKDFNNRLKLEINNENNLISLVVYRLTDNSLGDLNDITHALLNKAAANVPIRIFVEPDEYLNRKWPEFWLTHANIDKLWAAGVAVKIRGHQGFTHMKTIVTGTYASIASSNFSATWQRDQDYFVSAANKPTAYAAVRDRVATMWNDPNAWVNFFPQGPDAPTLSSPSSGATGNSTTPTLVWNRAVFATYYDVYVGTSQNALSKVGSVPAVLTASPPLTYSWTASSALACNTTYFWQIVSGTNATVRAPSMVAPSSVQSFTTNNTNCGSGGGGGGGGGTSTPFTGTAVAIPGTIQAENFDNGGEGVAYHDTTSGNSGAQYRTTDVDIEAATDNAYDVGWIAASEWLNYSVNVATAGTYTAQIRVACSGGGGTFHLEVAGVNKSGSISIPNTGGWQTWTTVSASVSLAAGPQILRVVMDTNGSSGVVGNINYMTFAASTGGGGGGGGTSSTPFTGTAVAIPGMFEAENFDNGGEGVAYHDTDTTNNGGQYRSTGVDIEGASENGFDVGWIVASEWLNYSVNVATAGTYTLNVRVASAGQGGTFHVEVGGVNKSGTLTIPNTGGWQNWTTISASVSLAAGAQILHVVMDTNGSTGSVGNLNWFNIASGTGGGGGGGTTATNVVIYAGDIAASARHGSSWTTATDATAAGGTKLLTPDNGASQPDSPLASPTDYVDVTFTAQANTPYRFWIRLKALNNSKFNDSLWVQFSDSSAGYGIGTTSGLLVNLATDSTASSVNNWGWQNTAYWLGQSTTMTFPTTGTHTLRIQVREDGVQFDQIVLSPTTYMNAAPGAVTNDNTIVAKP